MGRFSQPLHWSGAGDAFLVATGGSKINVYDRDGKERGESVAGDMYIRDLRNTKGHISPCTAAQWHPSDRFTGRIPAMVLCMLGLIGGIMLSDAHYVPFLLHQTICVTTLNASQL